MLGHHIGEGFMPKEKETEITFLRGGEEGCANLADDPKIALIAACIVMQQAAGFRDKKGNAVVDLRQINCPDCDAPGFNTGWGCFLFQCGAEIITGDDATMTEPCGAKSPAAA